jgi:hypothetical protein
LQRVYLPVKILADSRYLTVNNQSKTGQMFEKGTKAEKRGAKDGIFYFLLFTFYLFSPLGDSFCQASKQPGKTETTKSIKDVWDPAKYISIDEVRPGMEAYCLTVYDGTEVERFDLDVLSVVRKWGVGKDAILVQGTDERFIHTGPVSGCSGSPVYIDGRLAGALAYGWYFSKDPLYGVTPIEEMLRVGQIPQAEHAASNIGYSFDFSAPLDFAEIDKQITNSLPFARGGPTSVTTLPCPLIVSGLPVQVTEQMNVPLESFGLMAVAGPGGAGSNPPSDAEHRKPTLELTPGAALGVPVVTGDITMTVIGTVTEVVGDKVYGFGHSFLGYGPIDLPMATAEVHTVVSNMLRSFKFATAVEVVGALTSDESTAVFGRIGSEAKMIPLTITVDRYNDAEKRVYNCRLANNRLFTPLVLRYVVAGAALMLGSLPPDHSIDYKVTIGAENAEAITFENVSTGVGLDEIIMESVGSIAILMNNPYKKVDINSIDFDICIKPRDVTSHIWSVDLSDSTVKRGEETTIGVVVETVRAEKKRYQYTLRIPQTTPPGKYDLIVCGGYDYMKFLKETVSYRFIPQNLTTLIEAMNNILRIDRDRLYCILVLPSGGVTVEKAELPDLPSTKAIVLADAKRTLRTQPYSHWLEDSFKTGTVIIDKKVANITVEE